MTLDDGSHPTVRVERTGALNLGSILETEATTGVQYDPENDALTVRASLEAHGPITGRNGLSLDDGDVTTITLTPSGEVKVGADVSDVDAVDLAYDPTTRTVRIRNAEVENADLHTVDVSGAITLVNGDTPTARLGSNGLAIGADLGQQESLLFDLQPSAGTLAIAAVTTMQGDVTFAGKATMHGNTVSYGPLRFQTGDVVKAQFDPTGEFKLGPNINATDDIDLRYDPAARSVEIRDARIHNAQLADVGVIDIEVHGSLTGHGDITLGAADTQAIQTAQSVQQFDNMLAYYSTGVPSLNGRLLMGVANVNGGDPNLYMRMTRYFSGVRRIDIQASLLDIESDNIQLAGKTSINGDFEYSGKTSSQRTFRLRNLPTKPDGLPSGAVWNNHGSLNIVQ